MAKITDKKEYMKKYNQMYAKHLKGRGRTTMDIFVEEKYCRNDLFIEPTKLNFSGTELDNPIVCSEFLCNNHITHEQQLYGTKCIHCQNKKKLDITLFVSQSKIA